MPCHEPIAAFGDTREHRATLISSQRPTPRRISGQRTESCTRTTVNTPVRLDQLHRHGEPLARNLRKSNRHIRILPGLIFDILTSDLPSALDPQSTEPAVTVEKYQRLRRRLGHASARIHASSLSGKPFAVQPQWCSSGRCNNFGWSEAKDEPARGDARPTDSGIVVTLTLARETPRLHLAL
jgi:hypothetical protein